MAESEMDIPILKPKSETIEFTLEKTNSIKKYILYAVIVIVIIIVIYCSYYIKEHYITESVRSDSDTNGWDLRESINNYLKNQRNLLQKRVNNI